MIAGGRVWIQGAGELASGIAWRLLKSGYVVVLAEIPFPLAVRRRVCFSEAVAAGRCQVEGLTGELVQNLVGEWPRGLARVVIDPDGMLIAEANPSVIVDARMTKKRPRPVGPKGMPVIGLGPGFLCGRDADLVVETHRAARLGEVIDKGEALPDTGIPGAVGGETSARIVRSPADGRLVPEVEIGDLVQKGQVLGSVAGQPVISLLSGLVRGLVHPGAELSRGEKVGDVDPRGRAVDPAMISDKALAVGGGVLEALLRLGVGPGTEIGTDR